MKEIFYDDENGIMRDEKRNEKEPLTKRQSLFYGSVSGTFPVGLGRSQEITKGKIRYTTGQWLTLITLAFGNFCAGACVSLQAPFFPAEAERKGATPTEYGFIFGTFQLTIFVMAPLVGKLVPYTSPKFILNSGILTVGVTCVLFGTLDLVEGTTKFVALAFTIRIVEGIGAAALRTSCYIIIASQFSEGIGTTFAILETFLGIGLITGPTLGGALYDAGGYGLPFYVVGSIVIVDAIVIFFALPDVERTSSPGGGNLLKFWVNPGVLIYSLSVFTSFNYIGYNQATLEPHLRNFHLSGLFLGMMFALAGTIYAVSAPVWGWLCDKKCNSKILSLIGCFLTIASLLIIGPAPFIKLNTNLVFIIISLVLLGFGLGAKLVCAFSGSLQDTIDRGFPPDLTTYGLVSSMIASSQSLGAFVGPSIGGWLMESVGFRHATMVLFGMEGILVVCFFLSLIFGRAPKLPETQVKKKTSKSRSQNSMSNGYRSSTLVESNIDKGKQDTN